jgi:hypothetical protein
MSVSTDTVTFVSQLLDAIGSHLENVRSSKGSDTIGLSEPMSSNPVDDDELWLSQHRSIFSSYESDHSKMDSSSFGHSQYDGFHWDFYVDRHYNQLTFEHEPSTSQSHCSMPSNSSTIEHKTATSKLHQTSWQAIKSMSIDQSSSSSSSSSLSSSSSSSLLSSMSSSNGVRMKSQIPLYRLFQLTHSRQHPCRLYQNFSDRSQCDSLTSSSSSLSDRHPKMILSSRMPLHRPTTFSQLKCSKANTYDNILSSALLRPSQGKPTRSYRTRSIVAVIVFVLVQRSIRSVCLVKVSINACKHRSTMTTILFTEHVRQVSIVYRILSIERRIVVSEHCPHHRR